MSHRKKRILKRKRLLILMFAVSGILLTPPVITHAVESANYTEILATTTMQNNVTVNDCEDIGLVNLTKDSKTYNSSKSRKSIGTAKLSKKNKKARKAYKTFLEKPKYRRTEAQKFRYALIDLDNNGIDELLIDSNGNRSNSLYTFTNGKVKELVQIPFVLFQVYTDGTFLSFWGHTGYIEQKYYRLKNGSVRKTLEMEGSTIPESFFKSPAFSERQKKNAEYEASELLWYKKRIGNKNVALADCKDWIEKFNSSHMKMSPEYKDNTSKNRTSMLKKR